MQELYYFIFDYAFFQNITEINDEDLIYQQTAQLTISISLGKTVPHLFINDEIL